MNRDGEIAPSTYSILICPDGPDGKRYTEDEWRCQLAKDVADIARDLVLLWENQKIAGLPRSERNAAIDDIRARLTVAVRRRQDFCKSDGT